MRDRPTSGIMSVCFIICFFIFVPHFLLFFPISACLCLFPNTRTNFYLFIYLNLKQLTFLCRFLMFNCILFDSDDQKQVLHTRECTIIQAHTIIQRQISTAYTDTQTQTRQTDTHTHTHIKHTHTHTTTHTFKGFKQYRLGVHRVGNTHN